jgi:hypothetical protein
MQTRPSRRVLLFQGFGLATSRNGAVHAADSARSESVHQDCVGSNRVGSERRQEPYGVR